MILIRLHPGTVLGPCFYTISLTPFFDSTSTMCILFATIWCIHFETITQFLRYKLAIFPTQNSICSISWNTMISRCWGFKCITASKWNSLMNDPVVACTTSVNGTGWKNSDPKVKSISGFHFYASFATFCEYFITKMDGRKSFRRKVGKQKYSTDKTIYSNYKLGDILFVCFILMQKTCSFVKMCCVYRLTTFCSVFLDIFGCFFFVFVWISVLKKCLNLFFDYKIARRWIFDARKRKRIFAGKKALYQHQKER